VDRLTSIMLRLALIWLLVGFVIGGLMLTDRRVPGDWRLWLAPGHGHMLFVGWFLQFVIGVAYWLLPRKRSPAQPIGYAERPAYIAAASLNVGLLLRVSAEAAERSGHASDLTLSILAIAAALQILAAAIFVVQLWPRVAARPIRSGTSSTKGVSP
jgi:hypothetical protein